MQKQKFNNTNFINSDGKFDEKKFNKAFAEFKISNQLEARSKETAKFASLSNVKEIKPIYEYSIGESLIGIKDTWYQILDDILQQQYSKEIIINKNRPYFIGLTLVLFSIFFIIFNYFNQTVLIK